MDYVVVVGDDMGASLVRRGNSLLPSFSGAYLVCGIYRCQGFQDLENTKVTASGLKHLKSKF